MKILIATIFKEAAFQDEFIGKDFGEAVSNLCKVAPKVPSDSEQKGPINYLRFVNRRREAVLVSGYQLPARSK